MVIDIPLQLSRPLPLKTALSPIQAEAGMPQPDSWAGTNSLGRPAAVKGCRSGKDHLLITI
ncbi:hypothetical protein [Aminobacter niigataensis]|uniref:hypothetical protein n=1 Tax=Aminobacter niigataensis TaxID=83265 RepID=UPI0031D8DE78